MKSRLILSCLPYVFGFATVKKSSLKKYSGDSASSSPARVLGPLEALDSKDSLTVSVWLQTGRITSSRRWRSTFGVCDPSGMGASSTLVRLREEGVGSLSTVVRRRFSPDLGRARFITSGPGLKAAEIASSSSQSVESCLTNKVARSYSRSRFCIKLSNESSRFSSLPKNFWAWDLAYVEVLVATCCWTFCHSFP